MGRRRDRDDEETQSVESVEARAHGNDPDAVRMNSDARAAGVTVGV